MIGLWGSLDVSHSLNLVELKDCKGPLVVGITGFSVSQPFIVFVYNNKGLSTESTWVVESFVLVLFICIDLKKNKVARNKSLSRFLYNSYSFYLFEMKDS